MGVWGLGFRNTRNSEGYPGLLYSSMPTIAIHHLPILFSIYFSPLLGNVLVSNRYMNPVYSKLGSRRAEAFNHNKLGFGSSFKHPWEPWV